MRLGAHLPARVKAPSGIADRLRHAEGGRRHVVGVEVLERVELPPHLQLDIPEHGVGASALQAAIGGDELVPAPLGKDEEHRALLLERIVLFPEPRPLADGLAGKELGLVQRKITEDPDLPGGGARGFFVVGQARLIHRVRPRISQDGFFVL